jgi:hypothetical protein
MLLLSLVVPLSPTRPDTPKDADDQKHTIHPSHWFRRMSFFCDHIAAAVLRLVYLTWEVACSPGSRPADLSLTRDGQHATDVYLSKRCKWIPKDPSSSELDGTAKWLNNLVRGVYLKAPNPGRVSSRDIRLRRIPCRFPTIPRSVGGSRRT